MRVSAVTRNKTAPLRRRKAFRPASETWTNTTRSIPFRGQEVFANTKKRPTIIIVTRAPVINRRDLCGLAIHAVRLCDSPAIVSNSKQTLLRPEPGNRSAILLLSVSMVSRIFSESKLRYIESLHELQKE